MPPSCWQLLFCKIQQDTPAEPAGYHITEPVKEYLVRLIEQPICICGEPMTDSRKEKIQAFIRDHLITDDAVLVEKERHTLFNTCAQYQAHGFETRAAYFSLCEEIWKKIRSVLPKGKNLSTYEKILVPLMKKRENASSKTLLTQRQKTGGRNASHADTGSIRARPRKTCSIGGKTCGT